MAGTPVPAVPIDGKMRVDWVPALADPSHPKVSELTAKTTIALSCYLTSDGWALTTGQDSITDERLCSAQTYDVPGRKTTDNKTVTVIDNTNSEYENLAVETLSEGANGYFVVRRGVDFDAAYEADQKVSVYPARMGEKQLVAAEANTMTRSTIPFGVTGPWYTDSAVVTADAAPAPPSGGDTGKSATK